MIHLTLDFGLIEISLYRIRCQNFFVMEVLLLIIESSIVQIGCTYSLLSSFTSLSMFKSLIDFCFSLTINDFLPCTSKDFQSFSIKDLKFLLSNQQLLNMNGVGPQIVTRHVNKKYYDMRYPSR